MTKRGEKKRVFSKAEDAYVIEWRGKMTAGQIGARIGRSRDAVRRRWRTLGVAVPRPAGEIPRRAPRGAAAPGASDQELIEQYLAANDVTVCEPGTAAGLSMLERELHAAPPARALNWRQQKTLSIQAILRRRA